MENSLLLANPKLFVRRLRMNKNNTKVNIFERTLNIKTKNNLEKSYDCNNKNNKKLSVFPSLSKNHAKYYTKSNSRASSTKEEVISEKGNKSFIKKNIYNRKIMLKLPDKLEYLKKVRNHMIKRESNYFRTENNQKIIFNNIGINQHKNKSNSINCIDSNIKSFDKKDINSVKHYEKFNDNVKILLIKNNKLENEKTKKDSKIEALEQKIDKLINFIKNNETMNLKNKINELENEVELLKKENEKLRKELAIKNEIMLKSTKDTKNKNLIGNLINENNLNLSIKRSIYDIDIEKLKKISIDPDDI